MTRQSRTLDRAIAKIASRQHGVVTWAELIETGLDEDEIRLRLRRGTLIRVYRGVYRVGHRAPSLHASYLAAVKACGEGAVLSGLAAAHLYGLIKGPAPKPEVTTPGEREVKGVLTHRARAGIDRREVAESEGVPITTVPRTLVDIAGRLGDDELARACHEAAVRYRLKPRQVEAVLERRPRSKGAKRLRAILWGDTPVSLSKLESAFIALLRANGLPLPKTTNRRVDSHCVDCRWPDLRLTIELDSYRYHSTSWAWQRDRDRDREARKRGDRMVRYTWWDLQDPATVEELRALLTPPAAP